jgi:putative methyltransferase (TIGR04325 family)
VTSTAQARLSRRLRIMRTLKRIAVRLLPPLVTDLFRKVLRSGSANVAHDTERAFCVTLPEWEAVPELSWIASNGWLHPSILETQVAKWPGFVHSIERPKALGVAHEAKPGAPIDVNSHNIIMTFGYVLGRAIATCGGRPIRVLDWGGGLGHYALLARQLYPETDIHYTICELPPMADTGRKVVPEATFVADDDQALSGQYDLLYASSSLQYVHDFYGLLNKLSTSNSRWIMICRMPFVDAADDFVVVQRPQRYGYDTEYTGWFLNRRKFIDFMQSHGYRLDREFLNQECPIVANAPEQCVYRGFLFERSAYGTSF